MNNLEVLHVDERGNVTDEVLKCFEEIPNLKRLTLVGTQTTEAGRKRLKKAKPGVEINWEKGLMNEGGMRGFPQAGI
jgi:hypothetical protein